MQIYVWTHSRLVEAYNIPHSDIWTGIPKWACVGRAMRHDCPLLHIPPRPRKARALGESSVMASLSSMIPVGPPDHMMSRNHGIGRSLGTNKIELEFVEQGR